MVATYSGAQNQAADAPFMPTTFASPVAVIYGLGWWVRKYGQLLGAKKYEAARKAERANAIASRKNNVKELDSSAKRLAQEEPLPEKGWGGPKTPKQAQQELGEARKFLKKLDSHAMDRDKPSTSKYNPNKGKDTRPPASLLGPRLKPKKPKK